MLNFLSEGPAISPLKLARKEKLVRKRASIKKNDPESNQDHRQHPEVLTW